MLCRLIYEATVWYYKHLEGKVPMVMICDNPEVRFYFILVNSQCALTVGDRSLHV